MNYIIKAVLVFAVSTMSQIEVEVQVLKEGQVNTSRSNVTKTALMRSPEQGETTNAPVDERSLCAYLVKPKTKCGFGDFGEEVYVQNRRVDKSILATIETKWRDSWSMKEGTSQEVFRIPAGGKKYVGCTRGSGHVEKRVRSSYKIVGCEVLCVCRE